MSKGKKLVKRPSSGVIMKTPEDNNEQVFAVDKETLEKFAKAMNFSSTKNPRRREMNPNVPSCTTDLLYCLLHLTLDCPENEPIFRKYQNDKSLTELERRIATMKEVGFYMLDPDGSKSRDAFLKDIYAFYKEHHVPTSDNLIEKIDSSEGVEWYMPVYNNFDAVTSSNLIDISNMTDSTVKDRASMEKRYTIDQLKGSINDAARSALVDSYFDKYRPTEMNMFPYWLYMYPVCGFSQQIKPFQMLPVYDKGVYKISKYRYLQWKIIGVDENGEYRIHLADYADYSNIWILNRAMIIGIRPDKPYTYFKPFRLRYAVYYAANANNIIFNDVDNYAGKSKKSSFYLYLLLSKFEGECTGPEYFLFGDNCHTKYLNCKNDHDQQEFINSTTFNVLDMIPDGATDASSTFNNLMDMTGKNLSVRNQVLDIELPGAFININIMVNQMLESHRVAHETIEHYAIQPEKIFVNGAEQTRQVIDIDHLLFKSNDHIRGTEPNEPVVRDRKDPEKITYTTPAWRRRGTIRKLSNGTYTYVRNSICHRKGLEESSDVEPAGTVVNVNEKETYEDVCKALDIDYNMAVFYADMNKITIQQVIAQIIVERQQNQET
jgi:hypothetical protein